MKVICFGDNYGIPITCRYLAKKNIVAIVGATIRPQYLAQLKNISLAIGVPFLEQPKKETHTYERFVEQINLLSPDLMLVNSYSMLLPPELISLPRMGAINIHGALLPQYRGANPVQWAIINNEVETGVTMHYMDAHFDTGDIIAQKRVPILFEDSWIGIQQRVGAATKELLAEEISNILAGTNSRTPQDEGLARHWRRRKPEDGCFEWTWRAKDIYNLIRALVKPHPGAFYVCADGEKVVIDNFMEYQQVKKMQEKIIGRVLD